MQIDRWVGNLRDTWIVKYAYKIAIYFTYVKRRQKGEGERDRYIYREGGEICG